MDAHADSSWWFAIVLAIASAVATSRAEPAHESEPEVCRDRGPSPERASGALWVHQHELRELDRRVEQALRRLGEHTRHAEYRSALVRLEELRAAHRAGRHDHGHRTIRHVRTIRIPDECKYDVLCRELR